MTNKINPSQLELGYSPNNLRYLRRSFGLTQKDVAMITGGRDYKAAGRWEAPIGSMEHADMPYAKWQMLKEYLKIDDNIGIKAPVLVLDLGVPNTRRVISGSLANTFSLEWTKPLEELEKDAELAIDALRRTQGFLKNLIMFGGKNIRVYRGNNHIDIVADGKGSLNWLFVGDSYVGDGEEY